MPNIAVPRPLQENTSAPAGGAPAERLEPQRQRLAQILVGRARVASVQPHHLAGLRPARRRRARRSPGRRRARRGRGSRPARSRACRRRSRSRSAARRRPAPRSRADELGDDLLDGLERGAPGELVDHVALGGGDRHLAADGARRPATRTAASRRRARLTPTAPPSHTSSPKNSAPSPVGGAGAREPAEHRDAGRLRPRAASSTASVGNEYGSDSMITPLEPVELGEPDRPRARSSSPVSVGVERRPRRRRRRTTPPTPRRAVPDSSSRPPAEHAAGAAADQRVGREHAVHALERRLGRDQVRAAGEHEREVGGCPVRALPRPRGRLGARRERVVRGRDAGAGPHGHRSRRRSSLHDTPARWPRAEVIALFGPTGVGKTDVAIALAGACGRWASDRWRSRPTRSRSTPGSRR